MTMPDASAEIEAATQRVRELGERVADQARKNGLAWLEAYEAMLKNMLDLEEQAAKGADAEWAGKLATTDANFVRATAEVVLGAMRQQLKGGSGRQAGGGRASVARRRPAPVVEEPAAGLAAQQPRLDHPQQQRR